MMGTGGAQPMRRKHQSELQLSLFEPEPKTLPELPKNPTVLEFIRARFEHGPDMTQEEYKRWIKILVNHSLKRMD